jgi:TrmH family RNA methyltransferase
MLTNPSSDRVKRVRRLTRRSVRLETGRLLVEGPQAVREAAAAGLVLELYWTDEVARRLPGIAQAVAASGGEAHPASAPYVEGISPAAQGVVAVAADPWRGLRASEAVDWPRLLARGAETEVAPLLAVFEQLRDPGNAGAAIRAADAAGADAVVLADNSVDPTAPKVVRSSAGSYFHLPVISADAIADVAGQLRAAGLTVLAADGAADAVLGGAGLRLGPGLLAAPLAWVFGNEARGLSPAARAAADLTARIPIYGQAESLNVALAAAICLYAAAAARRALP